MSNFKIDIEGLNGVQKAIDDMKRSVDPNTLNEWADRVGRTAKQLCNDPDCTRIKVTKTGEGQPKFEISSDTDKEAIDCIINSIKRHLNSMPDAQKEIFKRLIVEFEARKKQS